MKTALTNTCMLQAKLIYEVFDFIFFANKLIDFVLGNVRPYQEVDSSVLET